MKNTTLTNAKFPSRGKLLDFFIKTLEIENVNDADRKRGQRFVSEENISIKEYNEILEIYIDDILNELIIDESKVDSAKNTIEEFFKLYLNIIQNVEVYAFKQECINTVLTEHLYLPFLIFFNEHYMDIKIDVFSSDKYPLHDIFNMVKTKKSMDTKDFKQYLFHELNQITNKSKSDKTLIQSIQNWLDNKAFPTMQNIEYIAEIFSNVLPQSQDELKQYFIVAKIIDKSNISKDIIFNRNLSISSEKVLDRYIVKCNSQYQDIRDLMIELYTLTDIQQEKTKEMEIQFEQTHTHLKEKGFNTNSMPYIAWVKARYHTQKNELKEATKYYILALENGKNSMGKHYSNIVKEGLIVSAQITREKQLDLTSAKSPFVKFYKEAYFLKLIDSLPDEINQYFLNDTKKQFSTYFTKLYPNTKIDNATKAHEHGIVHPSDLEKIKIDLQNPNKLINNKFPNPMTQLMYYAGNANYKNVKKLLEAGADVNITRFNDNGTALTMVLSNIFFEEKKENALKIAELLITRMSKDALCAKLPKKKMTALGLAIDLGYVKIVKSLINKGADVNQIITSDKVSPLYYALGKIAETKIDSSTLLNKIDSMEDQEIIDLVNSMPNLPFLPSNKIFDQEKIESFKQLRQALKNSPKNKGLKYSFAKIHLEQAKENQEKYYQIFDLLLNSDPNLEIRFRGNMHSVLILATQLNEVEIVKKLLDAGADKHATIDDTYNPEIKHTAKAFAVQNKNQELIGLL